MTVIKELSAHRETKEQENCPHTYNKCHNYMLTCKQCGYHRPMGIDLQIRVQKPNSAFRNNGEIKEYVPARFGH